MVSATPSANCSRWAQWRLRQSMILQASVGSWRCVARGLAMAGETEPFGASVILVLQEMSF
jgi:hypothetical protein